MLLAELKKAAEAYAAAVLGITDSKGSFKELLKSSEQARRKFESARTVFRLHLKAHKCR
jgi:hypothetical protein